MKIIIIKIKDIINGLNKLENQVLFIVLIIVFLRDFLKEQIRILLWVKTLHLVFLILSLLFFWLCITERVEKTIHNVDAAMKSAGRQKRDVAQTMMVDQLKKKAADLMSKLKNKQQG